MEKILFVASEAVPFIKTGGLADVMGALPKELAAKGMDVRLVIPKYSLIKDEAKQQMKQVTTGIVNLAWRQLYYGVDEIDMDGVKVYFIDNEWYFKRDRLYGYADDDERFAYFCRAVLTMLPRIGFQPDIIHGNDWHTGMLGVFLKEDFYHDDFYKNMKFVYTIHNLKYQGIYPASIMQDIIGLPQHLFDNGNLECDGCVNYMKSGMVYADYITTVSPTYAQEITYPYFGERLDGYARAGKRVNKDALRKELGLRIKRGVPMVAMVSRLVEDKGMDLVTRIMDELVEDDVQLVIVGTGDWQYEEAFRDLARRYPTKVSANIMFNEGLAHRVYAAADIFLMPSRYEPCGLSQLIALRYGAVPVVRETGGLRDTVVPFDKYKNQGNGLTFPNFNAHELLFTAKTALGYYEDTALWDHIVKNAMESDYSWKRSAQAYADLYKKVLNR